MGREIRKVPANWEHPKRANGDYIPLWGNSFSAELAEWQEGQQQWLLGYRDDHEGGWKPLTRDEAAMTFEQWNGAAPVPEDYMPDWPEAERTHIQLYEDTTEGTPRSPVFPADQLRALCEWAEANGASVFGGEPTTADEWYRMLSDGKVSHTIGNKIFI
jgi:hypothetical protein